MSKSKIIRQQIWGKLQDVARPDTRFHMNFAEVIPDFEGSEAATEHLVRMPQYQSAGFSFITPDNCLVDLRRRMIAAGKTFVMSTYGIYRGFLLIEQKDLTAVIGAVVLVGLLLLFLNKSKMGRAIRALGDDHQAALSVGISLSTIWVLVWFIAGIIALATGIVWGARAGVSFALEVIAYKALPVLMLGGLESIAGAIIGFIEKNAKTGKTGTKGKG